MNGGSIPRGWSIFTHDDLPPVPGKPVPPPPDEPLHGGHVSRRPGEWISDYDVRRAERQAKMARAIRSAVATVVEDRRRMLEDRALLIGLAETVDDVLMLVDETERIGVKVRRR